MPSQISRERAKIVSGEDILSDSEVRTYAETVAVSASENPWRCGFTTTER
jgi:hypothetical protein